MIEIYPIRNISRDTPAGNQTLTLAIGILLTMLPVTMIVPVLKELVSVRFQLDVFWAHAFMSTSLIGAIFFAPLAGWLIDRGLNRRLLFSAALAGNALCFAAMALAPTFAMLMLARFVEGAMHITALSGWLAMGAESAVPGRAGRTMGALGGMIMLGVTIGVPLGGVIAGDNAIRVLWAAAIVSAATSLFATAVIPAGSAQRIKMKTESIFRLIRQTPLLFVPYAYTFIDRLCVGVVVSTLGIYMSEMLAMTPAQRGMALSFFLVPFSLLSYPAGRLSDRAGRLWMMAAGSVLFGVVFMFYGYAGDGWFQVLMVLSGVLSALMFAPTLALCKDLSGSDQHGAVFAGYNIAGSLGFIVGPLLGGGIFYGLSQQMPRLQAYQETFVITGFFEVICVLVSVPLLIRLYRKTKKSAERKKN